MQYEGRVGDLVFINDAKSTNIDATMSAIKTLSHEDLYLILGGQLRSHDVSFALSLINQNIKKIFVFGEAAEALTRELAGKLKIEKYEKLVDIMEVIKKDISVGTILFSPAFPSFDQYKNYVDRGETFSSLVRLFKPNL